VITVAPFQDYATGPALLKLLEVIFEIICRTSRTEVYFQQHTGNDTFIYVIFSSEIKKKKKTQEAKSGKKGGWGTTATYLVTKNCCADKAVCTSIWSRSNNQSWFCHCSRHFCGLALSDCAKPSDRDAG
jgi:hypothetical protein